MDKSDSTVAERIARMEKSNLTVAEQIARVASAFEQRLTGCAPNQWLWS